LAPAALPSSKWRKPSSSAATAASSASRKKLLQNQELTLKRQLEGDQIKTARARIVAEIDREPEGFLYAIHLLDPRSTSGH